LTIQIKG